jgi:SAM-dependent methyltransferase
MNKKFCPICNFKTKFVFVSKHNLDIYQCQNSDCLHFYTVPLRGSQGICVRDKDLESESDEFLSIYKDRNKRLINLFYKHLGRNKKSLKILDFGAGNVHLPRSFKSELSIKNEIYCYDLNPDLAILYKKYGFIHVNNLEKLPTNIDFIYMIEVIEHIINPYEVLAKLKRSLNPKGIFFISTPIGRRFEFLTNAFDTPSHIHFFTPKSLNLLLKKSGFCEIKYQYYSEMYPYNTIREYWYQKIKKIAKITLLKISNNRIGLGHLVGFTRVIK